MYNIYITSAFRTTVMVLHKQNIAAITTSDCTYMQMFGPCPMYTYQIAANNTYL
jgi:hypothetical protein